MNEIQHVHEKRYHTVNIYNTVFSLRVLALSFWFITKNIEKPIAKGPEALKNLKIDFKIFDLMCSIIIGSK